MKRALVIWFFVAALVAMGCSPASDNLDSFGSVGTLQDSWIEIWDWYDLAAIRDTLSGNYLLMTDLGSATSGYAELAGPTADSGKGWKPIGGADQWDGEGWVRDVFVGTFDGQGHEVKDVFIYRVGQLYCDPTMMPCEKTLVGLFGAVGVEGVVRNVGITTADVAGDDVVGGLVGMNHGSVSNCYSTGSISGRSAVGGLVGYNWGGTVSDCHSTSAVASEGGRAGGLVGASAGTVRDSYSTGSVTCEMCRVSGYAGGGLGGLIGHNIGTVSNSYYNYDDVLIEGENIITIGALLAEDFQQWLASGELPDVKGRLSQQHDYYLVDDVSDFKQLLTFGQDESLKFRLQDNLDLGSESNFYIPYFAGEFDGRGHTISNLSFNFGFVSSVGLFGFLARSGTITGVGVEGMNIAGASDVGGLLGHNKGTVSNSYSSGNVVCNDMNVGGLVGWNLGGTINGAYSSASVTGEHSSAGGLVGRNLYSTVSNCYASGNVHGGPFVGGLVGLNEATVSNSYSTGGVTGESNVGGLVGSDTYGPWGTGTAGGSFWDKETSETVVSAGGTGKTTVEMKDFVTFSGGGWSIATVANASNGNLAYIWNIVDGVTYPFLSWEQATVVEYDLTITSTTGGSVTTPGEGTLAYDDGTVVNLLAVPHTGYEFVNWSGDAAAVDNINSASTTITMHGDYSIVASFEAVAGVQTTWYVDDDKLDCPAADFSRIQDAMDASSYGDTIVVCPGNYHEIDPVIEAGREVIIEAGAVWRVRSLVLLEWAHLIMRGILYWQAGYSVDLRAEGASISIEGGHGYRDYSPFLIVEEAQTNKDVYLAHESVQVSGLVTDQNGTGVSANVTAEVTTPGGSVGTISLVETEPGTYAGTFSATSAAGIYRVEIRADLDGYTGHAAWTRFEVDDSGSLPAENGTVCVESATGTGDVCFTTSHGFIEDLQAIPPHSLPSVLFPHGMFNFRITDLTPGQTVTLTIEFPSPLPIGTLWWKYDNGRWYGLPNESDNGDHIMVISLTDGGVHDLDNVPAQITDPGGPGNPMTVGWEGSPASKAGVLAPWIILVAGLMAGASLLMLRRRRAQDHI